MEQTSNKSSTKSSSTKYDVTAISTGIGLYSLQSQQTHSYVTVTYSPEFEKAVKVFCQNGNNVSEKADLFNEDLIARIIKAGICFRVAVQTRRKAGEKNHPYFTQLKDMFKTLKLPSAIAQILSSVGHYNNNWMYHEVDVKLTVEKRDELFNDWDSSKIESLASEWSTAQRRWNFYGVNLRHVSLDAKGDPRVMTILIEEAPEFKVPYDNILFGGADLKDVDPLPIELAVVCSFALDCKAVNKDKTALPYHKYKLHRSFDFALENYMFAESLSNVKARGL